MSKFGDELIERVEAVVDRTIQIALALPKNLAGREIVKLVNANQTAGQHVVSWNGRDQFGNLVASGIYTYSLKAGNTISSRKLLFLK